MGKKRKLTSKDKVINKTILLLITIVWGSITIIAFATHYVAGIFATIILYILARKLIEANKLEQWIDKSVSNKSWKF